MAERGTKPLEWHNGAFFDRRFLIMKHASIYQVPAGDTLQAQIDRGLPIALGDGLPKPTLTYPTRAIEVAFYPTRDNFTARTDRDPAHYSREQLLLDVFNTHHRLHYGLVESRAAILRVAEITWLLLEHKRAIRKEGSRQYNRLLNPSTYRPYWIVALATKSKKQVRVGNWNANGIHIEQIDPARPPEETGVAVLIVPKRKGRPILYP